MLKLNKISLKLKNFRLIFFDFGLNSKNIGIVWLKWLFIHFLCIYIRAYMCVYSCHIWKEVTLPTFVTPRPF